MHLRVALLSLGLLSSCTQTLPTVQGDLDQPIKAALACFKDDAPSSLTECQNDGLGYRLYFLEAFRSSLGVIDLDDNTVLDQDVFTPGTTGFPLPGQAHDMVVSPTGDSLFVSSIPKTLVQISLSDHSQSIIPLETDVSQLLTMETENGFDLYMLSLDGNDLYRWGLSADGTESAPLEAIVSSGDSFSHIATDSAGTSLYGVSPDGLRLWHFDLASSTWSAVSLGPECSDGLDNDGDGFIDGQDWACGGPADLESGDSGTECGNGIDDDGDGLVDEEDLGCENGWDASELGGASACNDGIDNDQDGNTDSFEVCVPDTLAFDLDPCADGIDNDGDGLSDEEDPGCVDGQLELSHQAPCANGIDDNRNGLIDAVTDAVCSSTYSLAESQPHCSDGLRASRKPAEPRRTCG